MITKRLLPHFLVVAVSHPEFFVPPFVTVGLLIKSQRRNKDRLEMKGKKLKVKTYSEQSRSVKG